MNDIPPSRGTTHSELMQMYDAAEQESSVLTLTLPFPPSANHYLGRFGSRSYLKPEAKRYIKQVSAVVRRELPDPITVKVAVVLTVYFPDNRKRDLANTEKVLMDSLTRAELWEDDNHKIIAVLALVSGGVDKDEPRVVVNVRPIESATVFARRLLED